MLNIRYGMKFMAKHVVFMGTADTTNDGMHFIFETVWVAYKREKRRVCDDASNGHEESERQKYPLNSAMLYSPIPSVYLFL